MTPFQELKLTFQRLIRQFIRLIKVEELHQTEENLIKISKNIVSLQDCAHQLRHEKEASEELRMNAKLVSQMLLQSITLEKESFSYYQAAKKSLLNQDSTAIKQLISELIHFANEDERNIFMDDFAHIAHNPETSME